MTNKQLYNLVFENFIQAKRELIKEGYRKESFKEVDFNEVFKQTKHKMLEEKLKSLQRENEMLKKEINYKRGLKQESSYSAAGQGADFQGNAPGSKQIWKGITNIFAKGGNVRAIADGIVDELDSKKFFDKMMMKYKTSKQGLIDAFHYNVLKKLKGGMSRDEAMNSEIASMDGTLAESKRRRY
jgi:hypothetical protein